MASNATARSEDRSDHDPDKAEAGYKAEHFLAWALAIVAIVMGVIGLLRGFGIIEGDAQAIVTDPAGTQLGTDAGPVLSNLVADGQLWLFGAIAIALVAWALHQTEGVRARLSASHAETGSFNLERSLAWVFAAVTVGLTAVALLVGFGLINEARNQYDGMLWALAAVGSGVVTNTLRSVRHHMFEPDAEYIATLVSQRMGPTAPRVTGTTRGEPGIERR
jgi:hypothetical protein